MMAGSLFVILSMLWFTDNQDFVSTANEQLKQGYEWHWNPKERDPMLPALPLIYDDGSEKLLWNLQK